MRQPYENILLGNFILTLGYLAGQRGIKLNQTALQLLQQTPDDRTVGDLFANLKGRNFIFEFKRNELQVKSEFGKPPRAKLLAALRHPDAKAVAELSFRCHFMCFPIRVATTTLSFMPYASIRDITSQDRQNSLDLSEFCEALLGSVAGLGVPYELFSNYLDVLAHFADDNPPDGGGGGGMGAIMNISDSGEITVVEIDSLRVLARTLDHEPQPPTHTKTRTMSRGFER
ncbi:hypothetical protein ACLSSQ_11475 [Azospira sp. APE16]|uniref:hypothetical protein n=1 Tax=Azospira sp. APE16 TaxID=3394231 RepID=UPI003A4D6643